MDKVIFDKNRVNSFSDAVFSIAMTLLVLEIGVPGYKELQVDGTLGTLTARIPSFIGLLVSFLVTALYWAIYMRIMKYTSSFDTTLFWLNIFLLLFVVLLPFSTAFYVSGFNYVGPFVFYSFNLSSIALFMYFILRYIAKKEGNSTGLTPLMKKWLTLKILITFWVWIIAGIMAFIYPLVAKFIFLLIFVIQAVAGYYFKRQNKV